MPESLLVTGGTPESDLGGVGTVHWGIGSDEVESGNRCGCGDC